MLSINKPCRLMLPSLALVTLLLSGCSASSSGASTSIAPKYPTQPLVHKFDLSARQGLRDLTGDFSVGESGADTGILLPSNATVEIFVSGKAAVQPGGNPSEPDGTGSFRCIESTMPEPSLPCYSIIYSVGIYGRAGEVGAHVAFNPTAMGNLFLGMNAPRLSTNSGLFHVTVLIIPSGTITGFWAAPDDRFSVQGTSMTLSAYAFGQNVTNLAVNFTISVGQSSIRLGSALPSVGNLYTCNWDLTRNGTYLNNGKNALGFSVNGVQQNGSALVVINPDGLRTGMITYEKPQLSNNYAGYAALDFTGATTYQEVSGSWTVPTATCSNGETSDAAIWVGMTPSPQYPASDNPIYRSDSPIFQIGSDSGCFEGQPHYFIAWEAFPQPLVVRTFALRAGDLVTATVIFKQSTFAFQQGDFLLGIDVHRLPGTNSITPVDVYNYQAPPLSGDVTSAAIAECIVDTPPPNTIKHLTHFIHHTLTFNLNHNHPIAHSPPNNIYKHETHSYLPTPKAITSALDASGSTFTVPLNHG